MLRSDLGSALMLEISHAETLRRVYMDAGTTFAGVSDALLRHLWHTGR